MSHGRRLAGDAGDSWRKWLGDPTRPATLRSEIDAGPRLVVRHARPMERRGRALAILLVAVAFCAFVLGYAAGQADAAPSSAQDSGTGIRCGAGIGACQTPGPSGAPSGPERLDPSDGNQEGSSSEGSAASDSGTAAPLEAVTRSGIASTYGPGYDGFTASPWPRGTVLEICGPGGCAKRTTNDVGPDQRIHPDRVVDLDVSTFELVCGVSWRMGLCPVVVTVLRRG